MKANSFDTSDLSSNHYKIDVTNNDFETPFVDQSTYLQRANNKNFKSSSYNYEGQNLYRERAVNNVDFTTHFKPDNGNEVKDLKEAFTSVASGISLSKIIIMIIIVCILFCSFGCCIDTLFITEN